MLPLLFALASAADLEAAIELATVPTTTESQERFGGAHVMPTLGGRVGLALTDALTVQLAAHHGRRGARWQADGRDIGAAAFYATDVALGLEAVVPVNEYFALGGLGEGTGTIGLARFDSEPNQRDSVVQKSASGFAPGFRAALALRITVPESAIPTPLVFRTSAGYQWSSQMNLDEFGQTALRGFGIRTSVGLQF